MRQEDINALSEPYTHVKQEIDRRFHSALGADAPSSGNLVREIFADLSPDSFGISWWTATPVEERILISDYLYQCANGVELNLIEAKLHYMEWLDAREKKSANDANFFSLGLDGTLQVKVPPARAPIDNLLNKLEGMHLCGFFRAIGSSLDCLGAIIIGVLGLETPLRRSDIRSAGRALSRVKDTGTPGSKLQIDFREFFEEVSNDTGPEDWLVWADQYRNMFVHRGRRYISDEFLRRENLFVDLNGRWIPRVMSVLHLAKHPDKSDAEAMIKKEALVNEDGDRTLRGIFDSCRKLDEFVCERLLSIWKTRRSNPSLIDQPASQWDADFRSCKFTGYDPLAEPLEFDWNVIHPVLHRRMKSAALKSSHRALWTNSKWNQ